MAQNNIRVVAVPSTTVLETTVTEGLSTSPAQWSASVPHVPRWRSTTPEDAWMSHAWMGHTIGTHADCTRIARPNQHPTSTGTKQNPPHGTGRVWACAWSWEREGKKEWSMHNVEVAAAPVSCATMVYLRVDGIRWAKILGLITHHLQISLVRNPF